MYALLMTFLDQSPSFTNGFAMGQMWQEMTDGKEFEKRSVHRDNWQQIELMAEHFGYDFTIAEYDEDWILFTGKPIDISDVLKK